MSETREQQARELAASFDFECTGADDHDYEDCQKCAGMRLRMAGVVVRALAACALAEAHESKEALLAARSFVRGRHSTLSYGPRVLLEQLDLALNRIERLERAAGEGK